MKKIRFSLLLAFFTCLLSNAQQADTTICINPEVNPSFQYDTCTTFGASIKFYFIDNFKIPDELVDCGYSEKIVIELIIEKDGRISKCKSIRRIAEPLDSLVVECAKKMPPWKPAIDKGKAVRAKSYIPVSINWLYGNADYIK